VNTGEAGAKAGDQQEQGREQHSGSAGDILANLGKRLVQHVAGGQRTATTLGSHPQLIAQVTHGAGTLVDAATNLGVGHGTADANVHEQFSLAKRNENNYRLFYVLVKHPARLADETIKN